MIAEVIPVAMKRKPAPAKGSAAPRLAPPVPVRSGWLEFRDLASKIGIGLYPWQETAARYLTALTRSNSLLYPEVAVVVARQQGKTTLLLPLILGRLLAGRHVVHTAQNRELPREIHDQLAILLLEHFPSHVPDKRGIRYGAGQEGIRLKNGASYRIVAPIRGGARGPANDLVIIDELREMESSDFIAAAKPTLAASPNPQIVYLSNAGTEDSMVLNALRLRADTDPSLAYLEWSAAPDRSQDDIVGWCEANPAIGHNPSTLRNLEREYRSAILGQTMAIFETEHLCRWVVSMQPRLVTEAEWQLCRHPVEAPRRPMLAISMDPSGTRASAAIAWNQSDSTVALRVLADVTGDPIDVDRLGPDLRKAAVKLGVTHTAFDPWTDADLARHLRNAKPLTGREYANASENFVRMVNSGRLRWDDADQVTGDLAWTARKPHESGAWQAVKAKDDRPIPAALAAIRAIWLACDPDAVRGNARVY